MIKNILLALIAAATFTACHAVWTRIPQAPKTDFEFVCSAVEDMYDVGCGNLEAPIVVESVIIEVASWGRWRGVYFPKEKWVFIDPRLTEPQKTITMRHEIAHYVLEWLELIPNNEKCEHERVARLISGGVWDNKTKRIYGCPVEGA